MIIFITALFILLPSTYGQRINDFFCHVTRAAFDVGSGSTRMRVYKYDRCSNEIIEQVKFSGEIDCSPKEMIDFEGSRAVDNKIDASLVDYAVETLGRFKETGRKCGAIQFSGVATAAFRKATNGLSVVEQLNSSGVPVKRISQREEAILGYQSAMTALDTRHDDPSKEICVWDIGGSSMQIVCRENGVYQIYPGDLASQAFKTKTIDLKLSEAGLRKSRFVRKEWRKSPNPINEQLYTDSKNISFGAGQQIQREFPVSFPSKRILGIGGVLVHSLAGNLKQQRFSSADLYDYISSRLLDKDDSALGGGDYVDSLVTNFILVEGIMQALEIGEVETLDVNLTEGLAVSPEYWVP